MTHYRVCVWIDHYEARIFGIGLDEADVSVVRDAGPHHHIHRKADHVHLGAEPVDVDFLDSVAAGLRGAGAILICGPGKARFELAGYLNDRHPAIGRKVWAVEPMDHPTDAQLVDIARRFFRAANRMHA